jgi:DNA-directed RNA polymerase delta subunit
VVYFGLHLLFSFSHVILHMVDLDSCKLVHNYRVLNHKDLINEAIYFIVINRENILRKPSQIYTNIYNYR